MLIIGLPQRVMPVPTAGQFDPQCSWQTYHHPVSLVWWTTTAAAAL